jgi:hypothetical protein
MNELFHALNALRQQAEHVDPRLSTANRMDEHSGGGESEPPAPGPTPPKVHVAIDPAKAGDHEAEIFFQMVNGVCHIIGLRHIHRQDVIDLHEGDTLTITLPADGNDSQVPATTMTHYTPSEVMAAFSCYMLTLGLPAGQHARCMNEFSSVLTGNPHHAPAERRERITPTAAQITQLRNSVFRQALNLGLGETFAHCVVDRIMPVISDIFFENVLNNRPSQLTKPVTAGGYLTKA